MQVVTLHIVLTQCGLTVLLQVTHGQYFAGTEFVNGSFQGQTPQPTNAEWWVDTYCCMSQLHLLHRNILHLRILHLHISHFDILTSYIFHLSVHHVLHLPSF